MKKIIFLALFLLAVMLPAYADANGLRPLTDDEKKEIWTIIHNLPYYSFDGIAREGQYFSLEQKITFISIMGNLIRLYGYDGNQSSLGYPNVPASQIYSGVQEIVRQLAANDWDGKDVYFPITMCGGTHQFGGFLALLWGMDANTTSTRKHWIMDARTAEYGIIFIDYGGIYTTCTSNYDKARTIYQEKTSEILTDSFVGDPLTGKVITSVNTTEGVKIKEIAGQVLPTDYLAGKLGMSNTDFRDANDQARLSNGREWQNLDFLKIKVRTEFVGHCGAIDHGQTITPGLFVKFAGQNYFLGANLNYSKQLLETKDKIMNEFDIITGNLEGLWKLNLTRHWHLNFGGDYSGLYGKVEDFLFGQLMFSVGSTIVYDSRSFGFYFGPLYSGESGIDTIQSQNPAWWTYPAFTCGARLDLGEHYFFHKVLVGQDVRKNFWHPETGYGNKAIGLEASLFGRYEGSLVEGYVPSVAAAGIRISESWSKNLQATVSAEREIRIWPYNEIERNYNFDFAITYASL